MADSSEVKQLKARIAELEQQLAEERDEFEWDLKTAKESSNQTIRKLEGEIERLKRESTSATQPSGPGKPEDVKMVTQRALLAERRVAELQEELKRASQLTPPPARKGDPLLRQRAEAAEREREELRKEKRALERSLEEKKASIERLKKEQEETRGLKRKLESAKKDLAQREKDLRQVRDAISGQGELTKETTRLQDELSKRLEEKQGLQSQLEQKEAKIRDLAQELNNLAAVEVERDSLVKEIEQLRTTVQERSNQREQQASSQTQQSTETEAEINRLRQELAQVQLASGQMVEQRERESARLKADLKEVSDKEATFAGHTDQLKREIARLRDELVVTSRERDELVSQLRAMRDDQETGVYVMSKERDEQADFLVEDTQLTKQPRGAEGVSHMETIRDGIPLESNDVHSPLVDEAEELFGGRDFPKEEVTQQAKPSFAKGVTKRVEAPPSPMEDAASEDELPPPAVESVPLAKMGLDDQAEGAPEDEADEMVPDLMLPNEEGAHEQTENVRATRPSGVRPVPSTMRVARPKSRRGTGLKVLIFGVLAGVLICGAYYFFPKWFGLGSGEEEEAVVNAAADAGEPAAEADAPVVATAPDAGEQAADAPEPDAAEAEEEVEEEEIEAGKSSPKVKKARAFAGKLLQKKKFKKALMFLEGWIRKEPDDAVFRYLLGLTKSARRWYKAAAEDLEKSIEMNPNLADAYYELGGVYIRLEQKDKACKALRKYVELKPSHSRTPMVKKNLHKLGCP